jgi:hypothetical protein
MLLPDQNLRSCNGFTSTFAGCGILDVIFALVILGEIWWRTRHEQQRGYLATPFLSLLYPFVSFATFVARAE